MSRKKAGLSVVVQPTNIEYVNPFSVARLPAARRAGSPAVAAEKAFDAKMSKYRDHFTGSASTLIPLAVTALGVWDERSFRWLRRFSDACAAASAIPVSLAFSRLMMKLSVALWRGNSQMLRACYSSVLDA